MNQFNDIECDLSQHLTEKLNIIDSDDKTEVTQQYQDENEDEDDFSFVFSVGDAPPTSVYNGAQIRPVFPLFDLDLLSDYDDSESSSNHDRLHQMKFFAETHSSSESDDTDGIASGPFCVWTKKGKDKKNNSTGFSKLWRFRKSISRSNSDGRDAFIFLKNPSKKEKVQVAEKREVGHSSPRHNKNVTGGVGGKVKGRAVSAHELYIKNKASSEDRRKSYLPYRPELFGFFTNVYGGGLSRNVHPY